MSRLEALRELRDHLQSLILAEHSEHGLQGVSGLVGQYQKCLADIADLEANLPAEKATVLDELKQRRAAAKRPAGSGRSSRAK